MKQTPTRESTSKLLNDKKTTSAACITTAIILDNGLNKTMTAYQMFELCHLADNIESLMYEHDESRFTLYDYMDAVINHPNQSWATLTERLNVMADNLDQREAAFNMLVEMADSKRGTYS